MDWQPADMWDGTVSFLKGIAAQLPERPKAILVVSAHWQTPEFRVTAGKQPELIYDYYGFPEHTYQLTYPALGAPMLAEQVSRLLTETGFENKQDAQRGFDHGVFIPLKLMFPDADIPVVQLSLRDDLDPKAHLIVGQALAALRQEGVLIIGSGMSFHNMRGYGDAHFTTPSERFDEWLTNTVAADADADARAAALCEWTKAPHALESHRLGAEEHLLPLMVIAAAAGRDKGHKVYSDNCLKRKYQPFSLVKRYW